MYETNEAQKKLSTTKANAADGKMLGILSRRAVMSVRSVGFRPKKYRKSFHR